MRIIAIIAVIALAATGFACLSTGIAVYFDKPLWLDTQAIAGACTSQPGACVQTDETITYQSHGNASVLAIVPSPNAQGRQFLQVSGTDFGIFASEARWLTDAGMMGGMSEADLASIRSIVDNGTNEVGYSNGQWIAMPPSRCAVSAMQITPVPSKPLEKPLPGAQGNVPVNGAGNAPTVPAADVNAPQQAVPPAAEPVAKSAYRTGNDQQAAGTHLGAQAGQQPAATNQGGIITLLFGAVLGVIAVISIALVAILMFRHPAAEQVEETRMLMNETRLGILNELVQSEKIPTDLSRRLNKSKATIVEHLDKLIDAGLVERIEEQGKKFVFYRLTQKGRNLLYKQAG